MLINNKLQALIIIAGILALTLLLHHNVDETSSQQEQEELIVYAGAAAAPVYREAAMLFETKYKVKVNLILGGSGSLLSSLEITRQGDIYIPGSPEYLLKANEKGIVNFTESKPRIFAYLVPAIIVQKGNPHGIKELEDLSRPGLRVGIGDPETVCVGLYAVEILNNTGLLEKISTNIVTHAASCEVLANQIYIGALDAIIGWHIFYYWSPDKSEIIWINPEKIHKIGYIAGAVTSFTRNKELAEKFLDFLSSPEVQEIWRKYGYYATLDEAKAHAPNAVIEELG